MNTLLLILLAYVFVSIVIAGMVRRAPRGYEDESGFHCGEVPRERGVIHTLGERRNLLNGRGKGLAVDDGAVILANRSRAVVQTIDVSDPDAPKEVGRFASTPLLSFEAEAVVARDGFASVADAVGADA